MDPTFPFYLTFLLLCMKVYTFIHPSYTIGGMLLFQGKDIFAIISAYMVSLRYLNFMIFSRRKFLAKEYILLSLVPLPNTDRIYLNFLFSATFVHDCSC